MTITNKQIDQLNANRHLEKWRHNLVPVVKVTLKGISTWLLTNIDPEDTSLVQGLHLPNDGFSSFSSISFCELLNGRNECGERANVDYSFRSEFPAYVYQLAEYHFGYLVEDALVLKKFEIEPIQDVQQSFFETMLSGVRSKINKAVD